MKAGLVAVVTASAVLGSILMFFAFSSAYHMGAGAMMGGDVAMTDECLEYHGGHGGMNQWMHDGCQGYHHQHDHDGYEDHGDCHEYAEDHEHYHEMYDGCSEHHGEHEDGHHMMHHD
jgi:hypothetical protein